MAKLKIVAADNIRGSGLELLRKEFGAEAVEARGKFDEEELCARIKDMDALLVRSGTTVTRRAIEAAGARLRLIGRAGVGVDNIDRQAATEKGIIVMNTPLGNTISAAEHAIALIFATARNVSRADALMQKGQWEKKSLVGSEVFGKTLGIVGLGKIGSHVAMVMKAAGMKILAYDPYLPPERGRQLGVEMADLDDLLARSDFITVHTPLTDKTRGLISAERLKRVKKGARLINCARGGIVDEAALAEAVRSGHLAGAGVDVFSQEPMTSGPLFGVPGIVLTPHLGASTEEAEERCCQQLAEQVVAYFKHSEILNAVNVAVSTDKSLVPFVQSAVAMGRMAVVLLSAPPQRAEVYCAGEIEKRDTGAITSGAVQGILEACGAEGVNIVNAALLAKQRGIEIAQVSGRPVETFRSLVGLRLSGGERSVEIDGTAYDNNSPRIVRINEFEIDLRPEGCVLILQYPDRPGYVGKFGTILGKHQINIGSMEVGRTKKRGRALMAIAVDEAPPPKVVQALARVEDVAQVQMVEF